MSRARSSTVMLLRGRHYARGPSHSEHNRIIPVENWHKLFGIIFSAATAVNQSFLHASGIPDKWVVFWALATSSLVNNAWAWCIWVHLAQTEPLTWWPHLLRSDATDTIGSELTFSAIVTYNVHPALLDVPGSTEWQNILWVARQASAFLDTCLELLHKWDAVMYWQLCWWSHGWSLSTLMEVSFWAK